MTEPTPLAPKLPPWLRLLGGLPFILLLVYVIIMIFGLHELVNFFTNKATGGDDLAPIIDIIFAPLEFFAVLFGTLISFCLATPWFLGVREAYIVNISVFLLGLLMAIFVVQDFEILIYFLLVIAPGLIGSFYWHILSRPATPNFK